MARPFGDCGGCASVCPRLFYIPNTPPCGSECRVWSVKASPSISPSGRLNNQGFVPLTESQVVCAPLGGGRPNGAPRTACNRPTEHDGLLATLVRGMVPEAVAEGLSAAASAATGLPCQSGSR